MSAERRRRPSAAAARIASQPYVPTDQRIQTIKAWVASLKDAPQPQLGRLALNTVTAPPAPVPQPSSPLQLSIESQYASIPLLAVAGGRVEPGTDGAGYRVQEALALHSTSHALQLQLSLLPHADYSNLSPDVRMKEPWERSTVASTMHTVSMLDWNADADAGSEFETLSDWTARPSRGVGEGLTLPVPPPPQELEGEKKADQREEKEEEEEQVSVYAPSSRSATPPRRVLPPKARRNTTTMPRRMAALGEDYGNKDIDLDAAIGGEPSEPKAKRRRFVSSGTTAVEGHSARSSPRSSPSPPPPPSTRRKGVLRGKVARRASFRPTANFGSRDADGSDSA